MVEYSAGKYPYRKRHEVIGAVQAVLIVADRYRTPHGEVEVIVRVTPPADTPRLRGYMWIDEAGKPQEIAPEAARWCATKVSE